jgi:hypothetical protein
MGMLLLVALLGWTDYLTGSEIAFSVFYFLLVAGGSYFVGLRSGLAVAGASAFTWLLAELLRRDTHHRKDRQLRPPSILRYSDMSSGNA